MATRSARPATLADPDVRESDASERSRGRRTDSGPRRTGAEEPPVDEEPKRESLASSDGDDEEDDYGGESGYEEEGEGEEGGESGYEGDEMEETEDEDSPTLEEQRSLLSLAAEHDRVDVIKELLQDGTLHDILLAGIDGSEENEGKGVTFVPPPLHAAVAHGSINAASCLLRMGADPSIRPVVPAQYLSGSYQPSPLKRSGSSANMEGDRNFKKYNGMSAWELAFGSMAIVVDEDAAEEIQEEEVREEKRGWFGFGTPTKKEEPPVEVEEHSDGKVRVRRKLPLNIPAAKLEGIRHAFTAEALRAIGSDEVDRLDQLLDAGMDGGMEVAGKTLREWAKEMDAKGCRELLDAGVGDKEEEVAEGDGAAEEVTADDARDDNKGAEKAAEAPPGPSPSEEALPQPTQPPPIHDERLEGLSLSDIQTLTRENVALIPQLTQVRDDLASETLICQSILKDVEATGGRGGLSSKSLLELVRGLKDQRVRAEEAADAWTRALEEREDELDFFWEEVLDDRMRGELGGILAGVEVEDPSVQGLSANGGNSMEECVRSFVEADDRVSSLRASIANLAEESSKSSAEIELHGMSGALSLTRSLREEIKGFEATMRDAIMGESLCRRKIEIIQSRLGNGNDNTAAGAEGGMSQGDEVLEQGYYAHEPQVSGEEEADANMEDYQPRTSGIRQQELQQEMQQQQGEPGAESDSASLPAPVEQREIPAQDEGAAPTESVPELNGTDEEKAPPMAQESDICPAEVEEEEDGEIIESPGGSPETEPPLHTEPSLDTEPTLPHSDVETMTAFERKPSKTDREPSPPGAADEDEMMTSFERKPSKADSEPLKEAFVAGDAGASPSTKEPEMDVGCASKIDANDDDEKASKSSNSSSAAAAAVENAQQPKAKKPSEAIAEGASTAIVVHKPNVQASLSSQIWEILRRIVGLRATPRSESYHDENHPHIMIV